MGNKKNCINCQHFHDAHGHPENHPYCRGCMVTTKAPDCAHCDIMSQLDGVNNDDLCGDCATYTKWDKEE